MWCLRGVVWSLSLAATGAYNLTQCSPQVRGILSADNSTCCSSRCELSGCGGPLCGNSTYVNTTSYNIECCVGYVQTYGRPCSSNFTAPCVLTKLNVTYTAVYNETYDAVTYTTQEPTAEPAALGSGVYPPNVPCGSTACTADQTCVSSAGGTSPYCERTFTCDVGQACGAIYFPNGGFAQARTCCGSNEICSTSPSSKSVCQLQQCGSGTCASNQVCVFDSLGSNAHCESVFTCSDGLAPCGRTSSLSGYQQNDQCCAANQKCVAFSSPGGTAYSCE